jgi:hypothetical protein
LVDSDNGGATIEGSVEETVDCFVIDSDGDDDSFVCPYETDTTFLVDSFEVYCVLVSASEVIYYC